MKKQKYVVTINADEHEGKVGEIVAYDRDKRYQVRFENGDLHWFKPHWLDGVEKYFSEYRFKAIYKLPYCVEDDNRPFKERYEEYVNRTRRHYKSYANSKHDYYVAVFDKNQNVRDDGYYLGNPSLVYFDKLKLQGVKRKIRYAVQNGLSFSLQMHIWDKTLSSGASILDYDQETGDWDIYRKMKSNKRLVESIERSVEKVLYKYENLK